MLLKTRRFGIRLCRDHLTISKTDHNPVPGTSQRTWYPLVIRWFPRDIRDPLEWRNLGVIIRRNWDDTGKRRKLSDRDEALYAIAKVTFGLSNQLACDQSAPQPMRDKAARDRWNAAEEIARLSRKSYPRR